MRIREWSSDVCSTDHDADDEAVGVGELRADRGGKAIAHRAEPAAGQPAVGRRKAEMLRRPHLMLADLGRDDRVHAARRVEQRLHRALRHDVGARLLLFGEVEAARRAPAVDAAPPFAKVARSEEHTSELQSLMRISYAGSPLK